jgi:hypothetical protein
MMFFELILNLQSAPESRRMDIAMREAAATTVHPRTVVKPHAAATAAAGAHADEATDQPPLQAEQNQGAEENLL